MTNHWLAFFAAIALGAACDARAPLVFPSRVADVYNSRLEPRILKAGTKMSDSDLVPGEPSLKADLDTRFPEWGRGAYAAVSLSQTCFLADLLSHIYVLVPVLDNQKHYWVGDDEVEKLLRHGTD